MSGENPGIVHSEACAIGTSHSVPKDCRGVDYKPILYPAPAVEPEIGHSEPRTNSEEGQRALQAEGSESPALPGDAEPTAEVPPAREHEEAEGADRSVNPDPAGVADSIPGVGGRPGAESVQTV